MAKKKTKTWSVALPVTGIVYCEVEAETEKEAIDKALSEGEYDSPDEWQPHRQIVQGNVFHGQQNEASAEEI